MNLYNKLELERGELIQKKNKAFKIGFAIIAIGFIILILAVSSFETNFLLFVGVPTILVGLIFVKSYDTRSFKKKVASIKERLVSNFLEKNGCEDITYEANNLLYWDDFYHLGLIKEPDRSRGEDLVTGVYKNTKFAMSDLVLQDRHKDSKGRVHYTTYFRGKVIIIDYPRDLDADCTLIDKSGSLFNGSSLKTEFIEFNETFVIRSNNEENLFKILSPNMMQKILAFKEMQKGRVNLAFTNDKLYITVNNGSDSIDKVLEEELNEENVDSALSELLIPLAIINEFRIDSAKFQN